VESLDAARLLQLAVDAKKTEKKMAIGEFLPQVAVGATYGYNAMMLPKNGSFNDILFATVKVPLTDIGKASARARRYDYAAQKAEIDRDYYLSRLRLQEAKCRLDVETLWMEISMAEQRVSLADDKLSKTRIRFSAGQATASEVLQASLEATSERESLLQTKTAYLGAVNAWRHR
jgi:outer membrane protein TolC